MEKVLLPAKDDPSYWARESDIKAYFGLRATQKWSDQGHMLIYIAGVKVWVDSIQAARQMGHFHRCMCVCPECGKVVPAGRLRQHVAVHEEVSA